MSTGLALKQWFSNVFDQNLRHAHHRNNSFVEATLVLMTQALRCCFLFCTTPFSQRTQQLAAPLGGPKRCHSNAELPKTACCPRLPRPSLGLGQGWPGNVHSHPVPSQGQGRWAQVLPS